MKAFYAGSFDPFTNGHLYIIKQAAAIFSEVIVAFGENPKKKRTFPVSKMTAATEAVLAREGLSQVKVMTYQGLTAQVAKNVGANCLIRGLRYNGMDYDYEENLAAINFKLSGLETIYFRAGAGSLISSSIVLELWEYQADLSEYLPPEIMPLLQ
jgi:pantetheine-phosphate adenylyltransferase